STLCRTPLGAVKLTVQARICTGKQSTASGEEKAKRGVAWHPRPICHSEMVRRPNRREPLTADERERIVLAINSAFRKLKNLSGRIVPIFEDYGCTPPSAGVIARDLSEKIEKSIIQHCESFAKCDGHCDLCRFGQDWEVKICKDSGLTINQSKV